MKRAGDAAVDLLVDLRAARRRLRLVLAVTQAHQRAGRVVDLADETAHRALVAAEVRACWLITCHIIRSMRRAP